MKFKELIKITGLPVVFASLCCLTPLVLVLVGLSSVTFAASLADTLYGTYKWVFRLVGLLLLGLSLFIYFRSKGICTIDQVKRQRKKIVNIVLLSLIVAIIGYVVFLYVIVELIGARLGIWDNALERFFG
jgi:amino acid transporter